VAGRLYRSDSVAYASAAHAAHLATTLARMRVTWGGAEGWARAFGLTGADLAALRDALGPLR
jgi:hypothetical protein